MEQPVSSVHRFLRETEIQATSGRTKVLDWMMALPSVLEDRLWQDIGSLEKERGMAFISSVEKIGMRKGFEKGHQRGLRKGMQEGMQEGLQKGLQKGMQKGLQKGLSEGAAKVLVRQLTTRFGPLPEAVVARLRVGTEADHARWAERLLTAPSLDAVFSDEPPAAH